MRFRKLSSTVAVAASGALVLSACGGGGGEDSGEGEGGTVSIYNCEPQYLTPGNSTEVCGSKILEQLFTGLTQVDYETVEAVEGVASDWETDDNITWTFTLNDDWTFHNGDPVTAQTFVDTWNWVVDPDNAQQNASFYDKFLGYQEVVDGDADELEGVRAVDDTTLEIELSEPFSPLPLMLSYTGFYPMPEEAFDDMDAFESAPVGNGRYAMDGEWVNDVEVNMDRNEDWAGEDPGAPQRIEWSIYSEIDTAYTDVQAGNLDVLDTTPPNRIPNLEADFGESYQEFDTSSFTFLGFPLYQEEFQDPDVRRALSMAIDRQEIIDAIFDGAQTPASGVIPPTLPQGRDDACEYCNFEPDEAADLYEEAGGPSELTVYFNSGAGHDDWVEAVSNQWQQHLDIDNVEFESLEFAQYLDLQENRDIEGPFRLGWVLSYPSPQYAMEPIYSTGGSSNYTDFSDDEFDQLIDDANAATDEDEADQLYQEAEDLLVDELPVIPMWFQKFFVVHSENIDGESITMDPRTFTRVEEIVVNE